jgi:uncharacterized membrane protein YedE/YeeE
MIYALFFVVGIIAAGFLTYWFSKVPADDGSPSGF